MVKKRAKYIPVAPEFANAFKSVAAKKGKSMFLLSEEMALDMDRLPSLFEQEKKEEKNNKKKNSLGALDFGF